MGYDMSIVQGHTEAEEAAKAALMQRINPLIEQRNKLERGADEWKAVQEKIDPLCEELWSLPTEYYRLNNWGMSWCREYMLEREMIYPSDCPEFPHNPYPERDDFDSEEKYQAALYEWEEAYEALTKPTRELHPDGGDTIPSHKLSSNDGWIVTEAECAAAVAAAAASELPAPTYIDEDDKVEKPLAWWPEWVDFLERASTRGGFTVR